MLRNKCVSIVLIKHSIHLHNIHDYTYDIHNLLTHFLLVLETFIYFTNIIYLRSIIFVETSRLDQWSLKLL